MCSETAVSASVGMVSVVGLCISAVAVIDDNALAGERAARAELSSSAQRALAEAQVVIGSQRQLEAVANELDSRQSVVERVHLPRLSELRNLLDVHCRKPVVMLASGDPLFYGIGRWLAQHVPPERLVFIPAISSIQLACSRIGLSWQDVRVVSLHGRPVESIRVHLHHNARLLVLTDRYSHPVRLAQECMNAGVGLSTMTVFEKLGYPDEMIRQFSARELAGRVEQGSANAKATADESAVHFDALNLVLLELAGAVGDARYLPSFPGIPDHCFSTGADPGKGMITKREARLVILSYLSPGINDVIWDIGAGCGSVAVELAYWNSQTRVFAIEHHETRLHHLQENRQRFGVLGNLTVVPGRAPDCLADIRKPNKVFIGGSDGELAALLTWSWQQLPDDGVLVASAVTTASRTSLEQFAANLSVWQVESVELTVKRGALINDKMHYTGKLPVEIYRFCKHEQPHVQRQSLS